MLLLTISFLISFVASGVRCDQQPTIVPLVSISMKQGICSTPYASADVGLFSKIIKVAGGSQPFLAVLDTLVRRGVEVRLLHAKEPGPNFQAEFDRYPMLIKRLQRRLCPRVHFKMLIFDCKQAYIGSTNLTGAGIGMKSDGKRNFEAGIFTDDLTLVDAAADHFNRVWTGEHCNDCKRKAYCGDIIKR